ncbi:hypothetical protein HZB00_01115 [Candidatus Woesearchaeota archaeon]|nr:hypothetical protein [Candidatus Woesearchaeota archaeon]
MAITTIQAVVTKITDETPTVKNMELTFPEGKTLGFKSGQWASIEIPKNGEKIRRAFSIASPQSKKTGIDLCVKKVEGGLGSTALHQFKIGEQLTVIGPFGQFFLRYPTEKSIVFIATGSGVAPFRAMVYDLMEKNAKNNIWFFFGNKTEEEIIYKEEFEEIEKKHHNFHFVPILSRASSEWKGKTGRVQEHVAEYLQKNKQEADFYICGLKDMVMQAKELLEKEGQKNIYFERYN